MDHVTLDVAANSPETQSSDATALKSPFKARYGNFIDGAFVDPVEGRWFDNV